jgi:hypothetical protein
MELCLRKAYQLHLAAAAAGLMLDIASTEQVLRFGRCFPIFTPAGMPQCVEYHNMCRADSSLIFCKDYNDAAKKVADSVLKNKGADPQSQQATAAGATRSAAASNAASALFVAVGAAAAMLVL